MLRHVFSLWQSSALTRLSRALRSNPAYGGVAKWQGCGLQNRYSRVRFPPPPQVLCNKVLTTITSAGTGRVTTKVTTNSLISLPCDFVRQCHSVLPRLRVIARSKPRRIFRPILFANILRARARLGWFYETNRCGVKSIYCHNATVPDAIEWGVESWMLRDERCPQRCQRWRRRRQHGK